MANIKCGIVGLGTRGKNWADNFSRMDVDLVALCDIQESNIDLFKKKYNVEYGTQDYDEFLKKSKELGVNFVVIATPHYKHAPQTIKAAENGFNVFCEKPMAQSTKECDAMIEACKKYNVKLNIGFQKRYKQNLRMSKKIIEDGVIGDVFHINMHAMWFRTEPYYLNSSPVPENEDEDWEGWRGHWKTEGGSALINQTIHILDEFLFLGDVMGGLKDVQANAHVSMHDYIECEDNVAATVTFKNGGLGLIQAGTSYKFDSDEIRVYGTQGTLIMNNRGVKIKGKVFSTRKLKKQIKNGNEKDLMKDFIEAIKNNSDVPVSGEEGRKTIELIRAIYQSVLENKKISIPFEDNEKYPELNRMGLKYPGKKF